MPLKICIPVGENSLSALLERMEEAAFEADIIELWLGELFPGECSLDQIFSQKEKLRKPILLNIKAKNEQGNFIGTDKEKYDILLEGIQRGAEYIDIGHDYHKEYLRLLLEQKKGTSIILSAHFFEGTPSLPALLNRIENMKKKGADIVKIAAMAKEKKDLLTILRLAENMGRCHERFIAISMGILGKSSRVLTPYFGGEMMFAALDSQSASAPGQMTVKELRETWSLIGE